MGADANVKNWCARAASVANSGEATSQPIFHPVSENILPADPHLRVRSAKPDSEAIGTVRELLLKEGEQVALLAAAAMQARREEQNNRMRNMGGLPGISQPRPGGAAGPGGGAGGGGTPRGGGRP